MRAFGRRFGSFRGSILWLAARFHGLRPASVHQQALLRLFRNGYPDGRHGAHFLVRRMDQFRSKQLPVVSSKNALHMVISDHHCPYSLSCLLLRQARRIPLGKSTADTRFQPSEDPASWPKIHGNNPGAGIVPGEWVPMVVPRESGKAEFFQGPWIPTSPGLRVEANPEMVLQESLPT
jgi:hypothetical protein